MRCIFPNEQEIQLRYCPYCRKWHEFEFPKDAPKIVHTLFLPPEQFRKWLEVDLVPPDLLRPFLFDRLPYREPYQLYTEAKEIVKEGTTEERKEARTKLERAVKLLKAMNFEGDKIRDLAYARVFLAEILMDDPQNHQEARAQADQAWLEMNHRKDTELAKRALSIIQQTEPNFEAFHAENSNKR